MARVLLLALLIPISLVQGYYHLCNWTCDGQCQSTMALVATVPDATAFYPVAPFGAPCNASHPKEFPKKMCCMSNFIQAHQPEPLCSPTKRGEHCPDHTYTLFTMANVVDANRTSFCCKRTFFTEQGLDLAFESKCHWREGDCSNEWKEVVDSSEGTYSYFPVNRHFQRDMKVNRKLCCKYLKQSPKKGCRFVDGVLCPSHKLTLFITETSKQAFCCDYEVFGKNPTLGLSIGSLPEGSCEWTGCGRGVACNKGYTAMEAANTAWSGQGVGRFGESCPSRILRMSAYQEDRTLCCKSEVLQDDPTKYCYWSSKLCVYRTITLFVKEADDLQGFCCEPNVIRNRTMIL